MALDFEHQAAVGYALMLLGTIGLVLIVFPSVDGILSFMAVPAVIILTLGTYFVGTDIQGRPV